jgi:hypothetical protein
VHHVIKPLYLGPDWQAKDAQNVILKFSGFAPIGILEKWKTGTLGLMEQKRSNSIFPLV